MKIGQKLNLIFIAIISLFAVFFCSNFIFLSSVHKEFGKITNEIVPVIMALDDLSISSINVLSAVSGQKKGLEYFTLAADQYLLVFQWYEKLVNLYFPDEKQFLSSIKEKGQEILHIGAELVKANDADMLQEGMVKKAAAFNELKDEFLHALGEARANESKEIIGRQTEVFKTIKIAIKVSLFVGLIIFLIIVVFAKAMIRSISRPLDRLRKAMHEVSSGKMDVRARVETNDELGDLASSFNRMVVTLEDTRRDTVVINNELMKANRELLANEDSLRLNNQTLAENEEELRAANHELLASQESLRRMTEELEEKVRARTRELEKERNALEIKVQERTKEIEVKLKALAEMNEKMTGRELRMIELKKQINGLMKELGRPVPYDI